MAVDEKERKRNDAVFAHQKNRNPFIDHPEWVGCLFGTECLVDGTVAPTTPPVATNSGVWINEIHYDNIGADKGEFVEIAGEKNTNLTGGKLIGYSGSNGGRYKTVELTGTIGDQLNGFGTLAFDFRGLQNGANDGIALVNRDGDVVEFISYEGSLTAVNGPARDLGSAPIGAEESGATPVGHSLQRTGSGQNPSSFSWSNPMQATRGAVNTGQTF